MGYKTRFPFKGHRNSNITVISGSFAPNGSSAVSAASNLGAGFSVARTGVGVFQVTLDDNYKRCLGVKVTLQLNTAGASIAVVSGAIDVTTAKTFSITVLTESAGTFAAADIAANANNRIFFEVTVQDGSIEPV